MAAKKTRKSHARKGHAHKKRSKKGTKKRAKKSTKKRSKKTAKKAKVINLTAKSIMKRVCRSKHVPVSLRKFC